MALTSRFNSFSITSLVVICSFILTSCHGHYHNQYFPSTLYGIKKGDHAPGLNFLRKYLAKIGYIDPDGLMSSDADKSNEDSSHFDDKLELAIRTYQESYNLKPTGILDYPTIKQLNKRRCGVPDVPSQMRNSNYGTTIDPQYVISNLRWPPGKRRLTYSYPKNVDELARTAIEMATGIWTDKTPFDINFIDDFENADIQMSFLPKNEQIPVWGSLDRALALSGYPPAGKIVFNADVKWVPIVEKGFDLATVTLHELGHSLGLNHSTDPAAVMYAYIGEGLSKWALTKDDLDGFKALYPNN